MPYDPADFPPATSHRAIAEVMTGPGCFTAALDLQEWIRDLIIARFRGAERPLRRVGGEQNAFQVIDLAGIVIAHAEYGSYWPTRTVIAPCRGAGDWWASCPGLIPAAAIITAARDLARPGPDAGARLEAAGWLKTANGEDGVCAWTAPDASRAACRISEGPDHGWLIHRADLPRQQAISAALTTPPGVIAALALTD